MKLVISLSLLAVLIPARLFSQIDTEPTNNALTGADMLALGVTNNASINPANDVDVFQFTVSQAGVVKITVTNVPANIDMDYKFYNELGALVHSANYGGGVNFVVDELVCTPGNYKVSLGDDEGNPALYSIKVDLDVTDIYECNNSLPDAKEVFFSTTNNASIFDENDIDFYKVNVTQPGVIKITVTNVPANIDMNFQFFNELGGSIFADSYGDGVNFVVNELVCNPGFYTFSLEDGDEGNPAQYTFKVDFDNTDIYECNNSLPEASMITLGTDICASIYDEKDKDFYKFNVSQSGVAKITVFNIPSNIDMDFQFFNELGISVYSNSFGNGENFVYATLLCTPGTYSFKLADDGEENAAQYCVRVDFDISDIYECNQDFNSAKPINCNTPVFASINPANDDDCYKIVLTQPDIITVNVSNVPSNLDLSVALSGPAPSTAIIKSQNGNTGGSINFMSPQILQPGTYYICITDNKVNEAQYKLTVTCPSVVSTDDYLLSGVIKIYPNPTNEMLFIEILDDSDQNQYKYEIRNLVGELISYNQIISRNEAIDVSKLPKGSYMIELKGEEGRTVRQFIKM